MSRRSSRSRWAWVLVAASPSVVAANATCRVEASAPPPRVVELYTSEGCNSCPPADRWLSSLRDRPDVIAAAFHVDYWDRLGWRDRFASARFTERQTQAQRHSGARFVYTPQVLVDGRDWRRWPALPPAASSAARVRLELQRGPGDVVDVSVQPLAGAPDRLAAWWAVLEDDHRSDVQAGENAGVTLRHDHVVRRYGSVPAWRGAGQWRVEAPPRGEGGRAVRLVVVVTEAEGSVPLQAAQLGCAG